MGLKEKIERAEYRITRCIEELDEYKLTLNELYSEQNFKCTSCKKHTKIKKLTILREHYYNEPHGCTGGGDWSFREYQVMCKKCGEPNRVHSGTGLFKWVRERVQLFKEQLDYHPNPARTEGLYQDRSIDLEAVRKANNK